MYQEVCIKEFSGSSLVAQWVKDSALSLLWCRFNPWPGNFHMLQVGPKKNSLLLTIFIPLLSQSTFKIEYILLTKFQATVLVGSKSLIDVRTTVTELPEDFQQSPVKAGEGGVRLVVANFLGAAVHLGQVRSRCSCKPSTKQMLFCSAALQLKM